MLVYHTVIAQDLLLAQYAVSLIPAANASAAMFHPGPWLNTGLALLSTLLKPQLGAQWQQGQQHRKALGHLDRLEEPPASRHSWPQPPT
jgi:hypothetical protein